MCKPDFIAEFLEACDVGLLLDLAHTRVSASQLDYGLQDYLTNLPLERVKQLHVSGPRADGKTLFDAHEPLRKKDYELIEEVLTKTEPWARTLEHGKDEHALLEQVARLQQLLAS